MKKKLEVEVRIRHHAKKLTKFGRMMKDMLIPRPRVVIHKNKVGFVNRNGTFILRGYSIKGNYVGVKITRGDSRKVDDVVKLRIVE